MEVRQIIECALGRHRFWNRVRSKRISVRLWDRVRETSIELFRELLNRRFLYKQVRIDKSQGLVFKTESGQQLPPTSLSTGEQHEVVILYQLLFLTQPDSLVLIDEPEISLHVAWQKPFLSDLARIAQLSKVDFLIATHSPQIISNRWDLTVELKSPN